MWYCLILEGIWRVFFLYNPFCQFLIPNFSVWSTQALINWNQSNHSFIPGLPHSFHRLQYGNARRAWYIVSHGHDVSDKMVKQKVTKAKFRAFLLWMTAVVVSLLFHLFYPHTTHMRLCTTTLTGFLYCKQWRAGQTRVMKAMDVEMAAEWGYLLTRKLYTCIHGILVQGIMSFMLCLQNRVLKLILFWNSSCYAQLCSAITSIATLAGLEHQRVRLRTGRQTTNVPQWRRGVRYHHPQHVHMIVSSELILKPNLPWWTHVNLKIEF